MPKYLNPEYKNVRKLDRMEIISKLPGLNVGIKRSTIVYSHMRDPALLRYYYKVKMLPVIDKFEMSGSSPTDIFIGRFGYPKVFIGPMLPPEHGDTSILNTPERWRSMSIERIVEMRSKLVRGMYPTSVHAVESGRMEEQIMELALAERPSDAEMLFKKKPTIKIETNDEVQPFGPSVQINNFKLYNIKADMSMEKMHLDYDATATTSIKELYQKGLPVSQISKGLSAGLFGLKGKRKFVPTRWSITAVDDTLSKSAREKIKEYDSVDAIYAYYKVALDNRWLIFFMPGNWEYESIEAWYPNTIWNAGGSEISIYSSYEGYKGRKTYAEIGGCYYSARLAVTEKLEGMKMQGRVLILREVHDGYIMPVGVWNVREHVRETLESEPTVLNGIKDVFGFIRQKLEIPPNAWVANSGLLSRIIKQRRIGDYLR